MKQKERRCDSPEPAFGGKTCEEQGLGASVETQSCNEAPCPSMWCFVLFYLLNENMLARNLPTQIYNGVE